MAPTATERSALPPALRRDSLWTLGLLGLTALAWAIGGDVAYLVLASGPATIIFAISALVNAKGVEAASGIRTWLFVAAGVGAFSLLAGLTLIVFRGPNQELEACMSRAITQTAERQCLSDYKAAYEDLIDRYSSVTAP